MQFINIDGPNGSGKTTLINKIKDHFEQNGKSVMYTHFPRYDTPIGYAIQTNLAEQTKMHPSALQMCITADRLNWSTNELEQYKQEYDIVLTDRYNTSSLVYGRIEGLSTDEILYNQQKITSPDMHIVLHLPVDVVLDRIYQRDNQTRRYENRANLEEAIDLFKDIKNHIPNVYLLNAEGTPDRVFAQSLELINQHYTR
jgi:dTMP kinase